MSNFVKIHSMAEMNAFLKRYPNAIVDFYADWCGPCKRIAPEFENASKAHSSVGFGKVNVDEAEEVSSEYKIEAMPTFISFKGGKKDEVIVGANWGKVQSAIAHLK